MGDIATNVTFLALEEARRSCREHTEGGAEGTPAFLMRDILKARVSEIVALNGPPGEGIILTWSWLLLFRRRLKV